MYDDLKKHIIDRKKLLYGNGVDVNKGYDINICQILNMKQAIQRYWDAIWNNYYIEFKKGKSIWLDLVRYSEIKVSINKESANATITLFFIPNNSRTSIEKIVCVNTKNIIEYFKLTEEIARAIISLNNWVPHSLNAQANITLPDIEKISDFIV